MIDFNFKDIADRTDLRTWDTRQLGHLLGLTERLAETITFNRGKINDNNREQVLADAKQSASDYCASRNKKGTTVPRSRVGETERQKEIRLGVEAWLSKRNRNVH